MVNTFARAVDIVGKSTTPFLTDLYLDSQLHSLPDRLSFLEVAALKLVDACEGKGIKIVWEQSPSDFDVDPSFADLLGEAEGA